MSDKQTEALKLALEALAASDDFLFNYHDCEPNNEREVEAYSEVRANNMAAWEAVREALAEQPAPPLECKTDAEKTAFAFGWWKALEENRKQPAQQGCMRCNTPKKCALYGCSPLTWPAEQPAQQQEPVAWMHPNWPNYTGTQSPVTTYMVNGWKPLYTSPQPAQQCKWPTCQSEEYQQALAEQIKRELYTGEPAQQQEPVGEVSGYYERGFTDHKTLYGKLHNQDLPVGAKLYTSPPASKPWVGLTDEEIKRMAAPWFLSMYWSLCNTFARAVEAKLREKNA